MRLFLFYILILFCCSSFKQKAKDDVEFSISFAACFKNDLVGLKVNGTTLISFIQVTSDPSLGITHLGAYQDKKAVWMSNKGIKQKFPKLVKEESVTLVIILNGKSTDFNVDLRKGKIIVINNCFLQGTKQEVTIEQYKETVLLD